MLIKNIFKTFLFANALLLTSCEKFVAIDPPPTQVVSSKVFENEGTATRAIVGIYTEMIGSSNLFSSAQTTFYPGLSADELYYYIPDLKQEFQKNEISSQVNHGILTISFWIPAYKYIYAANACIEGLNNSKTLLPEVKLKLAGEAKFIRAYCYFYLVNLFGDVPLITTTNYEVNARMPRTPKVTIYEQIINDLTDAQSSLPASYISIERTRPNKFTATALLARVQLYRNDWVNAESYSTAVIQSGLYSLVANLNNVFLKASNETIFQLQPGSSNINTWEGSVIIPASPTITPTYIITSSLLNSFEANDQRKVNWLQSRVFSNQTVHYPTKYKVYTSPTVTEYYVLLRLAEQYLIRAEARAQQNKIAESQADINMIRSRAGLPSTTANDKASLLLEIERQRQNELFAEWGHRWFDLKRTDRANAILGALKPTTWQATDMLWPIPTQQMNLNPALTQNPGY